MLPEDPRQAISNLDRRIHLDRRRMGHGRSDGQGENDLRSSVGLHGVWCVVVEGTLVVSYRHTIAFDAGVANRHWLSIEKGKKLQIRTLLNVRKNSLFL